MKLRADAGAWYCRAHYETTPEGQEQVARNMREAMEGEADAD